MYILRYYLNIIISILSLFVFILCHLGNMLRYLIALNIAVPVNSNTWSLDVLRGSELSIYCRRGEDKTLTKIWKRATVSLAS